MSSINHSPKKNRLKHYSFIFWGQLVIIWQQEMGHIWVVEIGLLWLNRLLKTRAYIEESHETATEQDVQDYQLLLSL